MQPRPQSSLLLPLLLALSCAPAEPERVVVHVPPDLPPGAAIAARDLVDALEAMAGGALVVEESAELPAPPCEPRVVRIAVLGHLEADATSLPGKERLSEQAYAIDEERCDQAGRRLALFGGSLLSGQWAVYDLLRRLGVRFFHPEETYFPDVLRFSEDDLAAEEAPWFQRRILGVHRTHPVELSPPLEPVPGVDMEAFQKRWIDWNVKLRNNAVNGWDAEIVGDYAYLRGFPRETGFNLLNSQQGGRPILDPDDPRSEEEQLAEAIEAALAPKDGLPDVTQFSFQFNPSEFTEADDEDTVRRLTFITEYITEHHPGVRVFTTNHGTHGEPTDHYGVRFFDLPEFAPKELGVKVHTLMFYDLERRAPVYGNEDFSHMLEWTRREAKVRRIIHFPEGSWWLTFDLPVPLYLAPVTLEARQHDLDLLRDLVADDLDAEAGVVGHRLFTSGQEWGYWLIDWCVSLMTWDPKLTHDRCLETFTSTFPMGEVLYEVLRDVERRQVEDMRDPEILRFLVGSDDETEVALKAGIHFHPLPPPPAEVLKWDDERVRALDETLERLRDLANDYWRFAGRVRPVLFAQGERTAPFVREVIDGLEVFALRAEHAQKVYETVLALRAALAEGDLDAVGAAYKGVEEARAITEEARRVIRRREAEYRYPEALTIVGDEPGTPGAIENRTIYPYRYLSRTHRLFYWTRPDDQLAELFGEGLEIVRPNARVLLRQRPLEIAVLADAIEGLSIDFGDGTEASELLPHTYEAMGFYDWNLDATTSEGAIHYEDQVAVVERRFLFEKGSLNVEYPPGASAMEGLLPGLVIGVGEDEAPFFVLGRIDDEEPLSARGSLVRRARSGLSSGPADLAMEILDVGVVNLYDAELEITAAEDPGAFSLRIQGEMVIDEIVGLLVSVGGFDEEGARELIAGMLDYTPETLPERDVLVLAAEGVEDR